MKILYLYSISLFYLSKWDTQIHMEIHFHVCCEIEVSFMFSPWIFNWIINLTKRIILSSLLCNVTLVVNQVSLHSRVCFNIRVQITIILHLGHWSCLVIGFITFFFIPFYNWLSSQHGDLSFCIFNLTYSFILYSILLSVCIWACTTLILITITIE